jgi:hypothetical protein
MKRVKSVGLLTAIGILATTALLLTDGKVGRATPLQFTETDFFPNTKAIVTLSNAAGTLTNTVSLQGPSTVNVFFPTTQGAATDTDSDGKDQVPTEMTQLDLTGTSAALGPVEVHIRPVTKHPFKKTVGQIEETDNDNPGTLDVPPFCNTPTPACNPGTADSFFNVYFEVKRVNTGEVFHNHDLLKLRSLISHKPPAINDFYFVDVNSPITLFRANETDSGFRLVHAQHTPKPSADTAQPTCSVNVSGSTATVTFQDTGSGLAMIQQTFNAGCNVSIPTFTPGTTSAVVVNVSKSGSGPCQLRLTGTDRAANAKPCDPVMVIVLRTTGKPVSQTFSGLPQEESKITIRNGSPGLKNLEIIVNGTKWKATGLRDNEVKMIDVISAMMEGEDNTITLTTSGKPGASAEVVISD